MSPSRTVYGRHAPILIDQKATLAADVRKHLAQAALIQIKQLILCNIFAELQV